MVKSIRQKRVGKKRNWIGIDIFDVELELTKMELSRIGIDKIELVAI